MSDMEEKPSPETSETLTIEETTLDAPESIEPRDDATPPPVSILHQTGILRPNKEHHHRCVSFGDDVQECCEHGTEDFLYTTAEERTSDEEECNDSNVITPSPDRRRTLSAMNSFRDSVSTLHLDDGASGQDRWKPWVSWSIPRLQWTALGCLSSVAVLTIRLLLDTKPTAYLIHSIIVFLDMVLIHLFTNSPWLSISGECMTIVFFMAFHFTKETLFELLETTLIAVLCSFHLIRSRNKHKNRNQALHTDMLKLRQSSMYLLRNMESFNVGEIEKLEEATQGHSVRTAPGGSAGWFAPIDKAHYSEKAKLCGEQFFEQFLDGSAGVMYTSFLGLIIDELLTYGQSKAY